MSTPVPAAPTVRLSAIEDGLRVFQQQTGTWVLSALVVLIVNGVIGGALSRVNTFGWIASGLVSNLMLAGMIRMALNQLRGHPIAVGDVFGAMDALVQVLIYTILSGIAVFIGFVLLIVPGFILLGLWMFSLPLIVDRNLDAVEAMRTSWYALRSEPISAALFMFLLGLVILAGIVCLLVGVLAAIPVCVLAVSILYREYFPDAVAPAPPPPVMSQTTP